jgi:hypothetical protein
LEELCVKQKCPSPHVHTALFLAKAAQMNMASATKLRKFLKVLVAGSCQLTVLLATGWQVLS